MTAQIADCLEYHGDEYLIAGLEGVLFERSSHEPLMLSTACYRGYFCTYACEQQDLVLREVSVFSHALPPPLDDATAMPSSRSGLYKYLLSRPWPLDGRLVVVKDLKYGGFGNVRPQPASYDVVRELVFHRGRLDADHDHSARVHDIRRQLRAFEAGLAPDRERTRDEHRAYCTLMWSFAPGLHEQPPIFPGSTPNADQPTVK